MRNRDHSTITCIPLAEIPVTFGYDVEILIISGNSIDMTREVAQKSGVQVIVEKQPVYGRA
jgi:hypothetical protein